MRNASVVLCLFVLGGLAGCGDNLQGNRGPTASDSNVTTPEDTPVTITVNADDADDDTLSFSVSAPEHGTITQDGATITYRPDDDYNGGDYLHVEVSDGTSTAEADITITVTAVNDAPVAVDDALAGNEDQQVVVTGTTLVANDEDVEDDALTVTEVANPSVGTVGLVSDTIRYTPPANFTGPATFEYTVSDGVATDVGTVTVTVGGVNDPPVAVTDTLTTAEDTAGTITAAMLVANDTDAEMQTLSVTGVGGAVNGAVALAGGIATFTPAANFFGAASFTYTVSDGGATAMGTVNVTVTPVNDTPVADAQSVTTGEDTPVTITLTGSDVEGTSLTFAIATPPTSGTLGAITPVDATSATVVYTPNGNYNGADSFTFTAGDGAATSTAATVGITVTALNDTPVATAGSAMTDEDLAVTITLTGTDADGDALTFAIGTGPTAGALGTITQVNATSATVVYTPNLNSTTDDSFTFTASDGTATSAAATVTIDVVPVNDPPVANAGSAQTNEDTPVTITLTGSDVEGANLTFSIVGQPGTGTLGAITPVDATSATVVYTPLAGSNQDDSFTFRVNDGGADSAPATVTIDVVGVNDPPVATAGSTMTNEDTAVVITLAGTDPDLDALTFAIAAGPTAGTLGAITQLTPSTASVTYTPNANSEADDSFTFTVSDASVTSAAAAVTIDVVPVNDPPVANAGSAQTDEDTPVTITLTGTDVEGSNLTFAIATPPAQGLLGAITQVTPTSASVTYTPALNNFNDTSFTFTVNDGTTDSAPATVTIDLTAVNDPPVAMQRNLQTDEDQPITVSLVGTDVDGDSLTFEIVGSPSNGTLGAITQLTPNSATVVFTPTANTNLDGAFTYRAHDGNAFSANAIVLIDVIPVDDPPIADAASTSTNEDTPVAITLSGSDVEGGALTFSIVMGPSTGTLGAITQLTPNTASVTFTPAFNFSGPVSFTFRVTAGGVDSAPATVGVTVFAVNDPPIAVDDNDSTAQDQPMVRLASLYTSNDTDVDGPGLTIDGVSGAVNGTVDLTAGTITFTPTAGYTGAASFDYNVTDGTESDTGTVNINVFVNTPPVAVDDADTVAEDTALVRPAGFYVAANDVDPDPQTLTVTAVSGAVNGTVDLSGGIITFTPAPNYNGAASFDYTLSDTVTTDVATVNITVTPVNDLPVANNDGFTVDEDSAAAPVAVLANDTDVEGALTVTAVTQPANGVVALDAGGVTFQPAANFAGTTTFTYTVTDSDSATATATVTMTVTPINDAPVANNATRTTNEATATTVTLTATDIDSASVTFAIATPPTNGTLGTVTTTGPFTATVQYTPTGTFFGADSFTFTAFDGNLTSPPATASITVNNVIICNDGVVELPETCDDQNNVNLDGCSSTCLVESGWSCVGAPSACDEICGDMIVVGAEECDDMNGVDTDGCTTSCQLAAVCTDVAITGGDRFAVDTATGHCYVSFDDDMTTFADAQTACVTVAGHLASITSAGEQGLVASVHNTLQNPWIGLTDEVVEGSFGWITGEALSFNGFATGQPDGGDPEDCANLFSAALAPVGETSRWNDTSCTFTGFVQGRICELEPPCGNGILQAGLGEQCDDGDNDNFDGCSATCELETLFFSEYIEGSSNNKAVEIANPTAAPIDLTGCSLRLYSNGSPTVSATVNLTQTVAAGDVFVVCHASANATIQAQCDLTTPASGATAVINYNGDDAVELFCGGSTRDAFGQTGVDPGTEWGTGLTSTQDNTLRRKCSVTVGDTVANDVFNPGDEWGGFANDTFGGLGSYQCYP